MKNTLGQVGFVENFKNLTFLFSIKMGENLKHICECRMANLLLKNRIYDGL